MGDKLIYDAKEPLWLSGKKPLSEAFLNLFHGTVSTAQVHRFEKLYRELIHETELIAMTATQFINQINSSYARYQEHRRLDSFQPMDEKSVKYVLEFLEESIREIAKEVSKNSAKSLIR